MYVFCKYMSATYLFLISFIKKKREKNE